jgi:membrane-associated phospholipid phosphatase
VALSAHVRNDSELVVTSKPPHAPTYPTAGSIQSVHSVLNSYPSGHAMLSYLFGFTLTQIVPEKHGEIE